MVGRGCTEGLIRWDSHQSKEQRVCGTWTWHGTGLEPCRHSDALAIVGLTIVAEVGLSRLCMYQLRMLLCMLRSLGPLPCPDWFDVWAAVQQYCQSANLS